MNEPGRKVKRLNRVRCDDSFAFGRYQTTVKYRSGANQISHTVSDPDRSQETASENGWNETQNRNSSFEKSTIHSGKNNIRCWES